MLIVVITCRAKRKLNTGRNCRSKSYSKRELKTGFARLNSSQASNMLKSAAVNVSLKLVVIYLKKLAAAGSSQK